MIDSRRQLLITGVAMLLCFIGFEYSSLDLWLQQQLFDSEQQRWIWSSKEPITRLLLYDGAKRLVILFALGLLLSLAFCRRSSLLGSHCRGIRVVLFSLILVPACVSALKASTNVACPRSLEAFDGSLPYVKVLQPYPQAQRPESRQRCFPAGHASGGFALMSLIFLFREQRRQWLGLSLGLAAGWTGGLYKMAIGDHFLSHTLMSMLIAWFLINLIRLLERRLFPGPDTWPGDPP
ncbi:MAG: phosphatase PAP2 family protein [Candidatus Thiodiazotropha sp.]